MLQCEGLVPVLVRGTGALVPVPGAILNRRPSRVVLSVEGSRYRGVDVDADAGGGGGGGGRWRWRFGIRMEVVDKVREK